MEPDILLIDEVLTVGDEEFQRKCFAKMKTLKRKGTTIVFVSHNLDWVAKICDRVMLLTHGRIEADGTPRTVIATYRHRV